jgi:hypothetical protein
MSTDKELNERIKVISFKKEVVFTYKDTKDEDNIYL